MSLDQDVRDIIFSYWSPSKTIEERRLYVVNIMHFICALDPTLNFAKEEKRLLDTIVTVPWGKAAYKHHDLMGDLRFAVYQMGEYVRNGFTEEQAWNLFIGT